MSGSPILRGRKQPLHLVLLLFVLLLHQVAAQSCSKLNPCATGCCSKFGYCGTGDEFCGADCVDTCDYKLGCDANNPCESGCCNKFGFCGLGPDYCGDDCVAGCDSKAYCDPGFGAEWSEVASCPLNVCCSKYGFCGTTEEFCGDRKVKRPSCPTTNGIQRVVGYYETWTSRRPCNQFWPESIPMGIYTHLVVAFAFIDPETFEIRPATMRDADLYRRVTNLKRHDPELKVFIAVGGWSYNDPGPTATTFSDLAASKDNQIKFFRSLTKFMATYNFDGVDLDWEYPGADDRSGRPEDYKNFPILLKNLKAALKATGGRSGLSITLPASYWYLQHFDIQNIVKYVDWFNVMSYDLHGTWDKGNKWLGEYLNAHTNLTEIQGGLDLLWRNHIPAEKVVLGLAFYARAFTVVDPGCTKPGCLFASGAEPGPCSKEVGILMNSEISDIIDEKNLKPTLYKDAAVKVVTWDDQWVAYDDGDTWKLKADFARSQCLGGLMVWAVSHDLLDGSFTKALGSVVGRKFVTIALAATEEKPKTKTIYHDQCKWTNCAKGCPMGWKLMPRLDPGHRENEIMLDDQGCHIEGESHLLCCPADEELPTCGWWTHNNGNCDGTCPDGMFEIGGNNKHCSKVKGNYQAACCTHGSKSVALYDNCVWGDSFECESYQCPNTNPDITALSCNGNGGSACGGDWRTGENEERKFCCDASNEDMKWTNCTWEDRYAPEGYLVVPEDGGDFCASNCPSEKVRVAMENDGVCKQKTGSRALCCTPTYTTTVNIVDQDFENMKRDLTAWYDSGGDCGSDYSWWGSYSSEYKKRQYLNPLYLYNDGFGVLSDLIYAYGSGSAAVEDLSKKKTAWDQTIGLEYPHLKIDNIIACGSERGRIPGDPERFASSIMCNLISWNRVCSQTSDAGTCAAIDLSEWDPEFDVDPDIYGSSEDDSDDSLTRRDYDSLLGHILDKRDGSSRDFKVDCGIDPSTGLRRIMIITSHPYPNGNDGNNLESLNGLTVRFALQNPTDCTDATINPNSPQSIWIWITEHILELQLIGRGIEFMVTGIMPAVQGLPAYDSGRRAMSWDAARLLNTDYSAWAAGFTDLKGSPMDRIWRAVGSKENPAHLVNAEYKLNSVKGRMFGGKQPIGNATWSTMNGPDYLSANAAIRELSLVIGVYNYINEHTANQHFLNSYFEVSVEWGNVDTVYNKVRVASGSGNPPINARNGWRDFMINFMNRMTSWVRPWVAGRIQELEQVWTEVYIVSTGTARQQADEILLQLAEIRGDLEEMVDFDVSAFIWFAGSAS